MEKLSSHDIKSAAYWIAVSQQQNFYEVTSDWNVYKANEHVYLQNYIGYALYGPPKFELLKQDFKDECDTLYYYSDKDAVMSIDKIYKKIIQFGTQLTDDKEVLCSVLYICMYDETLLSCEIDKLRECIYTKPVFKIRLNIKKENRIKYQNCYVDTEARVYKSWKDYLSNNNLPNCTIIAPKDGIYQADLKETWSDQMSNVSVEVHTNNARKKILKAIDTTSSLVNLGGIGVAVAAVFTSVAAPVLIAASAAGAISGLWGSGRGIAELVDRSTHKQTIKITHKEIIPTWLGVAGNTFGLAANCGSALLSRAIRTGTTITKSAQIAHDAILIGNLVVNGSGIIWNSFNICQTYKETGEVSSKDIFFLTAHLLFVCNSAINMKLASEIIKSDQNQILKDYEDSLRSNRHRKEFRRLVRNTGRNVVDEVHRNEQLIRALTRINNKDDFFASMVRNRKIFATTGTKVSVADGQVLINDIHLINAVSFANMSKDNILNLVNTPLVNSTFSNIGKIPSTGNSLISENLLKSGASAIRDYCVRNTVSLSMQQNTTRFKNIFNDLQNFNERYKILDQLLQIGLKIATQIVVQNYSFDDLLADTTEFVWSIVKINLTRSIPTFNMYEEQGRNLMMKIVKATICYINDNWKEWTQTFVEYMNSFNTTFSFATLENSDEQSSSSFSDENRKTWYNDIVLVNPEELMTLSKEISTILIHDSLIQTESNLTKSVNLSNDLKMMCITELNDFSSKHSILFKFNLSDVSEELKEILFDLNNFEMKNIIFYKLIIISINVVQRADHSGDVLTKYTLVNALKFLWILVNINFNKIMPRSCILLAEYESFVVNIIIAFYKYQLDQPLVWLSAFHKYTEKYGSK